MRGNRIESDGIESDGDDLFILLLLRKAARVA
jgi:hypothetical protein